MNAISIPRAKQLTLAIELPESIPLVHIEVAKNLLTTDFDGVDDHIREGNIRWAFNIAAPRSGIDDSRSELRIYRPSLISCHHKEYLQPGYRSYDHLAHLPAILRACLPPGDRPWFELSKLARRWSCSPQHLQNLIDAGCLQVLARARMGANGSAQIFRESAEQFLTANCESLPINTGIHAGEGDRI